MYWSNEENENFFCGKYLQVLAVACLSISGVVKDLHDVFETRPYKGPLSACPLLQLRFIVSQLAAV